MKRNNFRRKRLPSDIQMDNIILKILDENLQAGLAKDNLEGIICNRFKTSIEIIKYIKTLFRECKKS